MNKGEVSDFGLALMQDVTGDTAGAKVTAEQARNDTGIFQKEQPENQSSSGISARSFAVTWRQGFGANAAERAIFCESIELKIAMKGPVLKRSGVGCRQVGRTAADLNAFSQLLQNAISRLYARVPVAPDPSSTRSDVGSVPRRSPLSKNFAKISSTNASQFSRLRT